MMDCGLCWDGNSQFNRGPDQIKLEEGIVFCNAIDVNETNPLLLTEARGMFFAGSTNRATFVTVLVFLRNQ